MFKSFLYTYWFFFITIAVLFSEFVDKLIHSIDSVFNLILKAHLNNFFNRFRSMNGINWFRIWFNLFFVLQYCLKYFFFGQFKSTMKGSCFSYSQNQEEMSCFYDYFLTQYYILPLSHFPCQSEAFQTAPLEWICQSVERWFVGNLNMWECHFEQSCLLLPVPIHFQS